MKENGLRAFVLLVLLSFTTPSLLFANSSVEQEISDQSAVHEQFKKERIEAIAKAAGLSAEEKQLVSKELDKYDEARVSSWAGIRKVYDEISKLGGKITSEQYLDYYKKIQAFTEKRHQASQSFMNALINQLTPVKAFKVYEEYRDFNANTGRKLRHR
nr:hypothetical protein [uncultured Porphyromonas sp.]